MSVDPLLATSIHTTATSPHTVVSLSSTLHSTQPPFIPTLPVLTTSLPSRTTMARFAPLVLLGQVTDLPQNYGQRLPLFYGITEVTARQNIEKITNFIDLE